MQSLFTILEESYVEFKSRALVERKYQGGKKLGVVIGKSGRSSKLILGNLSDITLPVITLNK